VHGDLQRDLLIGFDLVEVDVNDVGSNRMPLDFANQRPALLAVDRQVDQRGLGLDPRQRFSSARLSTINVCVARPWP